LKWCREGDVEVEVDVEVDVEANVEANVEDGDVKRLEEVSV